MSVCMGSLGGSEGLVRRGADGSAVQSSCRSLIVDTLPISKQQLGSAWGEWIYYASYAGRSLNRSKASRMTAIGHLIVYGVGTMNLMSIFGTLLGDSQLKQMSVIAAFALVVAVGVTSYAVKERVLVSARYGAMDSIDGRYL